eukprot:SAG25_NODE_373_length_8948_cov_6.275059_13_plen_71_part_00
MLARLSARDYGRLRRQDHQSLVAEQTVWETNMQESGVEQYDWVIVCSNEEQYGAHRKSGRPEHMVIWLRD